MLVEEREYITIEYLPHWELLQYHWKPNNELMTEEVYKSEMLNVLDMFRKYKAQHVLLDASKSRFVITLKLQEWVNEYIIKPAAMDGLKRILVVLSEEFIAQLSMEQMLEESPDKTFHNHYFASVEEVHDWLKSKFYS